MDLSTTILASVPELKTLVYFRCIVSNLQMTHEIIKEIYHCQILCCREIIRTFSRTLAAPVPQTEHYFYVIAPKKFCETNKLQEFLRSKIIQYSNPSEVTFEIYKICAKYSIIYKLSPVWNRVGEYLCKGQKASELTDKLDAIKFDLDITEEGMFLRFKPLKLKLSPLSLQAIGVAELTLKKFQSNNNLPIRFRHQKAYILPSLKNCDLVKVTKDIPNSCKFKSYEVIRDHWKNMYGIVLPKSKEGINFYQISFPKFEERTFIYPETCLQARLPKIIECNNPTEISNNFLEDLKVKIPKICGKELSFVYHNFKPMNSFVKPKKVQVKRGINDTPSKSSLTKNSSFCDSLKSLSVFNCDSRTSGSFSFQYGLGNSSMLKDSPINSKSEFVRNWLQTSCPSPGTSQETDSLTSWDELEKLRDSPLKKRMKISDPTKPTIRSIESISVSLSPFKIPITTSKNMQRQKQ